MWSGAILFVEKSVVPKKCLFLIPIPKPLSPGKGLNVGLPPSPRLGLRPKPLFKNYICFSTGCRSRLMWSGAILYYVLFSYSLFFSTSAGVILFSFLTRSVLVRRYISITAINKAGYKYHAKLRIYSVHYEL